MIIRLPVVLVATALVGVALHAERAHACGGLFCSQASPTPIDQAAERILFEVLDDGSVSATVEIKYQGNPNEFSWIVPVSGTPDFVDVAGKDELQLLDQATAPRIIPPTLGTCDQDRAFGGFPSDSDAEASEGEGEGGVSVTEYPSVGPFEGIVVVEGGDANELIEWLQDHGYQVTERMRPFIEAYTLEGYKFLATRLRADAEVQDMVPIRFHCPQPNPEIPLRLTAIAAEPEMGFLVFVAGPQRYTTLNYDEIVLDARELRMGLDPNVGLVNNYFALVSKKLDEQGGQGFVVERAQPAGDIRAVLDTVFLGTETEQASRDHLNEVLANRVFLTRFYARMNPEEMVADPIFTPRVQATPGIDEVVSGTLDLSGQTTRGCGFDVVPACGTLYCGDGDACATTDLGDGCVCRGNHTARSINSPTGGSQIVCTAPDIDLHEGGDPCASTSCGNGACVAVNDRPTCRCDAGNAAVIDGLGVRCLAINDVVRENDAILWPDADLSLGGGGGCGGCAQSGVAGASGLAALLLLLRRRRR